MIDIEQIRADFPALQQKVYDKPLIYLDNAATTHKPGSVLDRILEFYSASYSNIHRGVHYLSEQASNAYECSREKVKKFINAELREEIIFTHGTTEAINLLAGSFGNTFIRAGDEIIVSQMEHHSNFVPWQNLCKAKDAILKILPLSEDTSLDVEKLESLITPRTKLVCVTHVSNVLGIVNPVKKITEIAHTHDIPVLVDGAQAIKHFPVDVQDINCDFYVFSGHKMFAETGIGVLYGKEKWLDSMEPYQRGGGMVSSVQKDDTTYAGLPFKFEAGTPNIAGAVSISEAIEYINRIGLQNIKNYEDDLVKYTVNALTEADNIDFYNKTGKFCGVVSFNLKNINGYDAGMILDKMGIAVRTGTHCAEPLMQYFGVSGMIRASFAMYNTKEEADQLVKGIKKVQHLLQ
jgi:cysteine desulfurase/selenocysteine lyase